MPNQQKQALKVKRQLKNKASKTTYVNFNKSSLKKQTIFFNFTDKVKQEKQSKTKKEIKLFALVTLIAKSLLYHSVS